ncbi:hypothetical protein EYF80_065352 [Liparis tanakae]|uniref:Uncharacterized protein n=1 Tax=Liparis tanakae TaxID=230148 RepID=A0A4Z2E889_9TELE|nr:hypothetical protein EYF80_065352 [Liparis tanakae]
MTLTPRCLCHTGSSRRAAPRAAARDRVEVWSGRWRCGL